jgi:hypothetical protein
MQLRGEQVFDDPESVTACNTPTYADRTSQLSRCSR